MITQDPSNIETVLTPDLLKACIHCGMCLPVCPTYLATGSEAESPRGRLYLMNKFKEGELDSPQQLSTHLDQCLGCQACETACPSGVQYGSLLFSARKSLAPHQPPLKRFLKRFVFEKILPNFSLLSLVGKVFQFYQSSGLRGFVQSTKILDKMGGSVAYLERLLPHIVKRKALYPGMSFGDLNNPRVALMTGCVMDMLYNRIHWATIETLVANGYYVTIPEQTCCGALSFHAGETDIAQTLAKKNIELLLKLDPDWVVFNSAGCGSSVKEYALLFDENPTYRHKAEILSRKVVDVMELLHQKPLMPFHRSVAQTVTYHAACHLHHAQGIQKEPIELLSQIPGIHLIPLKNADACCGSAGVYNVEQPGLSQEVLDEKLKHVLKTKAEIVVTGNPGCLLQLEAGLGLKNSCMKVMHPIELFAKAYQMEDI